MGLLLYLLGANVAALGITVGTGFQYTEVAAFLGFNISVIGTIFAMMAMNGVKNVYDLITGAITMDDLKKAKEEDSNE